jgi:hypothetical protein
LPVSRRTHSRYGLHTRAVTVYRDTLPRGFSHFVISMPAPVLPAGAVAGWDLHPLESAVFARRTPGADIAQPIALRLGCVPSRRGPVMTCCFPW